MNRGFARDRKLQLLHLLFVNAIPLVGVFFLGWKIGNVVFIYWLETLFTGIFNLLKMIFAKGKNAEQTMSKTGACLFFTVHFFIFTFGQGMLIGAFLITKENFIFNFDLRILLATIFSGYLLGFLQDYILNGKYETRTPMSFFFEPYGRIFVQQILLIGTVFILEKYKFDKDLLMLTIFVGLKILADLAAVFISYLNHTKPAETLPAPETL